MQKQTITLGAEQQANLRDNFVGVLTNRLELTLMAVRFFISFLFMMVVMVVNSLSFAGDFATRTILGFSPDGRFFAFEQYGTQDGSGFPYADLIILDTKRNAWVKGSPFRTLLFDGKATIEQAREQSKKKAASLLRQMNISPRGVSLLSNPATELTSPHSALFQTQAKDDILNIRPYRIALKTRSLTDRKCSLTANRTEGLSLSLTRLDDANKTIFLAQEDHTRRLRRLRGCASDYKIADVLLFDPMETDELHKEQAVLVVLLHVIQQGFEGNDRRFMALSYSGAMD